MSSIPSGGNFIFGDFETSWCQFCTKMPEMSDLCYLGKTRLSSVVTESRTVSYGYTQGIPQYATWLNFKLLTLMQMLYIFCEKEIIYFRVLCNWKNQKIFNSSRQIKLSISNHRSPHITLWKSGNQYDPCQDLHACKSNLMVNNSIWRLRSTSRETETTKVTHCNLSAFVLY